MGADPDDRLTQRERRAIALSGAAFAAVAVVGFVLVPHLGLVWAILLVFGIGAGARAAFRGRGRRRDG